MGKGHTVTKMKVRTKGPTTLKARKVDVSKEVKKLQKPTIPAHEKVAQNPQLAKSYIGHIQKVAKLSIQPMQKRLLWPKYKNDKGDVVSYQAHHVIPVDHKGPNEWWNLHPVHPDKHQKVIHGRDSAFRKIFN